LRQADEALCKALGPVSGLFEQGTAEGGHPVERTDAFYTRLRQLLSHHMSLGFLGAFMGACPYAHGSGLLPVILCSGFSLRIVPRALAIERGVSLGKEDGSEGNLDPSLSASSILRTSCD